MLAKGKTRKPETFEVGQAEQLLGGIYLLLQQVIHTTAQKGAKHPKRFHGKPWPSVATALDALETEDRERLAEANRAFMAMFEFVPQDQFEAEMAEHLEALEAGEDLSPPQLRAAEQAALGGWGGPDLSPVFSHAAAAAASPAAAPPSPAPLPVTADAPYPATGGWAGWPAQP